ncbi:methyltransferase [Kibdelosporangium aridum]|uniref:Release factor glutamine methyltransferase n=1 Tax=Kibdelosporangium aridum TaxID=2030 RepID=A0A1Y5WS82_KIBAR|nr:class I SAM-dependent methyltransferase [Kibdelosporangium aridum]SMC48472.1 release factor glutamine methyltransferase [Kibdelosporangium aridum]
MDEESFRAAHQMYVTMSQDPDRPDTFTLLGLDWDLLPGVFAPVYQPMTEIVTNWLPFPEGGSFLEMGSGTGVTAVTAALRGCASVTALDIAAAAVENTRRNAIRHGVADRVRVLRSDLFDALAPGERFDMIVWNSDFIEAPEGFVHESEFQRSFFDPGYETHRRFVAQAPRHVSENGRLLLAFNRFGNQELLRQFCADTGLEIETLETESRVVRTPAATRTVEFYLLELTPAGGRTWLDLAVA